MRHFGRLSFLVLFLVGTGSAIAAGFTQMADTLWSEGWEGTWTTHWHVDGGTWQVGLPTSGPNAAYAGQNCAATVLAGNYDDGVNTRLIRHTPFVVPSVDPRLRFWHWYSFNSGDYGVVQISTDAGAHWTSVSATYSNSGSGVWTYPSIDLGPYAGLTVQVAFFFHSEDVWPGGWETGPGWYIDEVSVLSGARVLNNPEGFENGIGDWASERGTWQVGMPTSGPDTAYAGVRCAATVLAADYHEGVDSKLISPPFLVPNATASPAVQFWHWYSFNAGDNGKVQIKVNNGSWQDLSPVYSGSSSNVWTFYWVSLVPYADSLVQIGFFFHSEDVWPGGWETGPGWYIDEFMTNFDPVAVRDLSDLPIELHLYQNYPNPFNAGTTIRYVVSHSGHVRLAIFDIIGREVAVLVDCIQEAGEKSVIWDATKFASGAYLCRLQSAGVRETRRLALLK